MNSTGFAPINPTFIEHEGFYYLEFEGEFYKGCRRCGGHGHFSHNGEHSRCYDCDNTSAKLGDHLGSDRKVAEKWCHERAVRKAQADRKREAERLAKIAKRDAAWQALKDAHPMVWDLVRKVVGTDVPFEDSHDVEAVTERDTFVAKLADQLWRLDERPYTERQIAALQRVAEQRIERQAEAAAHPAPSGRVAVTGEIASAKIVEGDYGTSYKALVKADEGFKVWVSIPSALMGEFFSSVDYTDLIDALKGRRITFTATLEPSKDDPSFAFGSRPTKGAWL